MHLEAVSILGFPLLPVSIREWIIRIRAPNHSSAIRIVVLDIYLAIVSSFSIILSWRRTLSTDGFFYWSVIIFDSKFLQLFDSICISLQSTYFASNHHHFQKQSHNTHFWIFNGLKQKLFLKIPECFCTSVWSQHLWTYPDKSSISFSISFQCRATLRLDFFSFSSSTICVCASKISLETLEIFLNAMKKSSYLNQ